MPYLSMTFWTIKFLYFFHSFFFSCSINFSYKLFCVKSANVRTLVWSKSLNVMLSSSFNKKIRINKSVSYINFNIDSYLTYDFLARYDADSTRCLSDYWACHRLFHNATYLAKWIVFSQFADHNLLHSFLFYTRLFVDERSVHFA